MPSSWDVVLPAPLPEEDNFGALDEFKPFLAVKQTECPVGPESPFGVKVTYLNEKGMEPLKGIKALKIAGGSLRTNGPFSAASLDELRKKALADKRLAEDTASLTDAEAIHRVFADLEPLWKRLHAAKERTHAVLHIPLKPSLMLSNPMLNPLMNLASIAQLKARAYVSANQGSEALEECLLLSKIADFRAFPTLLEYLVRATEICLLMPAVFEGISSHVWSDAQLAVLEKRLAEYEMLGELRKTLGSEMLFSKEFNDFLHSGASMADPAALMLVGNERRGVESFLVGTFPKTAGNVLCSTGIKSAVHYVELLSASGRGNLRAALRPPDFHWGPLNPFAGIISPALTGVLKNAARTQSLINIARVAIALERHHLKQGRFPPVLSDLVPFFLPAVPVEVFDGEPLKYRLKDNAQGFILYSTGWKGTDDGGQMDYSKPNETNWVWSSP
jgi:hypothetical protein